MGHPQALKPNVTRVEHLPILSPQRKIFSSSHTTERRSHLGVHDSENEIKPKNFLQDFYIVQYHFIILMLQLLHKYLQTHVFYNSYCTSITFCEHLGSYNAFLYKINVIMNLGFLEGLKMTQWRSKHVTLTIYHLMYKK